MFAKLIKSLLTIALLCMTAGASAQTKIKAYAIHRNGNTSAYIYDGGTALKAAALTTDGDCYWLFIETGTDGGFYIQNARTKKFIQSAKAIGLNNQITVGDTPVEYRKGHDGNGTTSTWWLASADNGTFQTSTDGPLGLNYSADRGNIVVSYYIKTGRGNSYWEITEHEITIDDPQPPTPGTVTEIDPPVVVKTADQFQPNTLYTIESERGSLLCDNTQLWGSANASAPQSPEAAFKRFAFVKSTAGNTYLYNYGAAQFIVNSRVLSATPAKWAITENGTTDYRWLLSCKGNFINMQNASGAAGGVVINSWSTPDAGNRLKITAVAEVDMSSLIEVVDKFEEEQRKPIAKPTLAQRLGLVRIPCGSKGAYLTEMNVGEIYSYSASAAPATAYVNFATTDFFIVKPGQSYKLALEAANTSSETDIRIFLDWDGNGMYETEIPVSGEIMLEVPAAAVPQDTYMRVRITDNGLTAMDSDFEGSIYDFRVRVEKEDETTIADPNAKATVKTQQAYDLMGRPVHNPKHQGVYVLDGKKVSIR